MHIFRRSITIHTITNSKINGGTNPPSPLSINSTILLLLILGKRKYYFQWSLVVYHLYGVL